MKNGFVRVFALLFAAAAVLSFAALPSKGANDTTGRGIGYTTELYNNTNGLPTSDANAVAQTSEGFIWVGSYSGLLRYDGNFFYRYDSSTGISSVVSLYVDAKDRLWIGTNDSGVFVMEKGSFRSYGLSEGLNSLSIRSIIEDQNGNILFATTSGVAYTDKNDELHVIDDERINSEYVCELETGADGKVYALTNSGALFTIENLAVSSFYENGELVDGLINSIYPDPENAGWIYLGMGDATVIYGNLEAQMQESSTLSVAPQNNVACMKIIDGQLWISADNGIGYFNGDTYVPLSDLPMTNSVEHIFRDYEDNLWFTSSRQGLMKIVENRFIDVSGLAGLPELVVNSTWHKDGYLYLGTDSGLFIVDQTFNPVENEFTQMLEGVRIRSIGELGDGRLVLGTNSDYALLFYDPATGEYTSVNTESGLATDRARVALELSDGRIAVATNGGVNILTDGEVTGLYAADAGLRNLEILCLLEGPNGEIYAGSDGDGLYVINGSEVSRIGLEDGLSSDIILRLVQDPEDKDLIWVITSNAINYIQNGEIHRLRTFPYSNNFDVKFDANGRMWVISSNGLYAVKRSEMLEDRHISYSLFDTESGLAGLPTANSFNALTDDGRLFVATTTGVSAVNIFADMNEDGDVRLSVPYIMADDEEIYASDGVFKIPSDCRRVVIHAYAISFSLNNPQIRYMLEGFDKMPEEVLKNAMDPAVYTNLPGGEYVFHIATVDTVTELENKTLEVRIVKERRLTEQLWFWIVSVVVGIALILSIAYLIFRRRNKELKRKAEEHRQLINELAGVFAKVIDKKDTYTNGHSRRVAEYSVMLAKKLGKSEEEVDKIHHIALLHDIGKIGIPDEILNKPGRLTDEEFAVMKTHSQQGYDILKEISIEPELATGAGFHHERLDGRGYPKGLSGEEIPEIAQIIAVADTFDAMFSTRPYRKKMEISEIIAEVKRVSGTQLNPKIVNALVELIDEGAFQRAADEVK